MKHFRRYAVYALPNPAAFADHLAAWLGWDPVTGTHPQQPEIGGLNIQDITKAPRRYGAHATLKPPFRLAPGRSLRDLCDAVGHLAAHMAPVRVGGMRIERLAEFLALVPETPGSDLMHLAARVTRDLDAFRAPPSQAELERRRAAGLSPQQDALLLRWGYPFVMETFRFHLTLTGDLPPGDTPAVQAALEAYLAPFLTDPFQISDLCLVGEDDRGFLHLIRRFPLAA